MICAYSTINYLKANESNVVIKWNEKESGFQIMPTIELYLQVKGKHSTRYFSKESAIVHLDVEGDFRIRIVPETFGGTLYECRENGTCYTTLIFLKPLCSL